MVTERDRSTDTALITDIISYFHVVYISYLSPGWVYADEAGRQAQSKIKATKNGDNDAAGKSEKELHSRLWDLVSFFDEIDIGHLAQNSNI